MGLNYTKLQTNINDLIITSVREIDVQGGNVIHGIRKSDIGYQGFGEAYFSCIEYGAIKAWKMHKKMTLNLIVPKGLVRFIIFDNRKKSLSYKKFDEVIMSRKKPTRLTIPPLLWFGFQGIDQSTSLVLNIANIEHDPSEVERKNIDDIKYNWEAIK